MSASFAAELVAVGQRSGGAAHRIASMTMILWAAVAAVGALRVFRVVRETESCGLAL